jgi:transposase
MLKEKERWEIQVLHREGHSIRGIRKITHRDRKTIRDVLARPPSGTSSEEAPSGGPPVKLRRSGRRSTLQPFQEFLLGKIKNGVCARTLLSELRGLGFGGSLRTLQRYLQARKARIISTTQQMKDWMHLVLQGAKTSSQIVQDVGATLPGDDVVTLLECVKTKPLKLRNRALAVLAHGKGISPGHIASFLCVARATTQAYISEFKNRGIKGVLDLSRKAVKKVNDPKYAAAVFKTLHAPPSAFGFNRTTWRMDDLHSMLLKQGVRIARVNIRKIIKTAGYKFRKAKKVLTSTDPEYREKLQKITHILANLKPDEKFFSIDEFGPFAVKLQGGCALVGPGETRSVPLRQKSKGSLIATAALELSTNQITHFYSGKKNTEEMIRMLELLVRQYRGQTRIFFSWDAASWHGSKKFFRRVDEVNEPTYRTELGTPVVELAPLPSCAQFLNVIESVFSGMARAIIHNSDYASVEAAKAAIDRYFAERNDHFQKYPRRAGKKLWGKERVEPEFNEANNCKDPRW